jgi:hypothetical protein
MMKAAPVAPLVIAEAEFLLELNAEIRVRYTFSVAFEM